MYVPQVYLHGIHTYLEHERAATSGPAEIQTGRWLSDHLTIRLDLDALEGHDMIKLPEEAWMHIGVHQRQYEVARADLGDTLSVNDSVILLML